MYRAIRATWLIGGGPSALGDLGSPLPENSAVSFLSPSDLFHARNSSKALNSSESLHAAGETSAKAASSSETRASLKASPILRPLPPRPRPTPWLSLQFPLPLSLVVALYARVLLPLPLAVGRGRVVGEGRTEGGMGAPPNDGIDTDREPPSTIMPFTADFSREVRGKKVRLGQGAASSFRI
jgi:hypothetical protein